MQSTAAKVLWLSPKLPASITLDMDDKQRDYQRLFGGNLLFLRIQAGISNQPKLAELIGVSPSTVQRWEAGASLPDAWELLRLAEELKVDVIELLHPEPLSERERLLLRRAGRAIRRRGDGRAR